MHGSWRCVVPAALAAGLLFAGPGPARASIFKAAEPKLIYSGTGPGLEEGILVIRDSGAYAQAIAPLDPAFGGAAPDLKKRTVLRVVGRPRENRCRDTALIEVSTKNFTATVKIEERIPDKDCACAPDQLPPKVFLVEVDHAVRNATLAKTDAVIPCPEAARQEKKEMRPVQVFEGSWDGEPGTQVIVDQDQYKTVLSRLGLGERGPEVNFEKDRMIVLTGRPRENACRDTKVVDARVDSPEEASFELEEIYPGTGQMCAQVMLHPRVFLYRVPATVMRARVVTREAK